jgi:hypothetical protein
MCRHFDVMGIFFCIVKFRDEFEGVNKAEVFGSTSLYCSTELARTDDKVGHLYEPCQGGRPGWVIIHSFKLPDLWSRGQKRENHLTRAFLQKLTTHHQTSCQCLTLTCSSLGVKSSGRRSTTSVLRTLEPGLHVTQLGRGQLALLLLRELNVIDGQKKPTGKHQKPQAGVRRTSEIWSKLRPVSR